MDDLGVPLFLETSILFSRTDHVIKHWRDLLFEASPKAQFDKNSCATVDGSEIG